MSCNTCRKWVTQRVTDYEDGTRIVNFACSPGMGKCEILQIETANDFSCSKWEEGHEHVEIIGNKSGSPWHHYQWGICPDCTGVGWMCRRCAGTGSVCYYDDGFIGENQTRKHPNEVTKGPPPAFQCIDCKGHLEPEWIACPKCGARTNKSERIVEITEVYDHREI